MKNKIFDCTTFYNANLLFQTRFNILREFVDYFVVCEGNKDHLGNNKNYNFDKKFLDLHKEKIIYVKADDLPNMKIKGKKDYKILSHQMEKLFKGIEKANDDDLIIFSDEDEIPNPEAISKFSFEKFKFGIFLQNMYFYKINIQNMNEGNGNWPGSRICKRKFLKSFFKFRLLKTKNINYPFWRIDKEKSIELIKNGGWHFAYLMTPEEISKKISSMSHTEFNKEEFKNLDKIIDKIKKYKDPFNRDCELKKVSIDDSYPKYILNNLEIFSKWIEK